MLRHRALLPPGRATLGRATRGFLGEGGTLEHRFPCNPLSVWVFQLNMVTVDPTDPAFCAANIVQRVSLARAVTHNHTHTHTHTHAHTHTHTHTQSSLTPPFLHRARALDTLPGLSLARPGGGGAGGAPGVRFPSSLATHSLLQPLYRTRVQNYPACLFADNSVFCVSGLCVIVARAGLFVCVYSISVDTWAAGVASGP